MALPMPAAITITIHGSGTTKRITTIHRMVSPSLRRTILRNLRPLVLSPPDPTPTLGVQSTLRDVNDCFTSEFRRCQTILLAASNRPKKYWLYEVDEALIAILLAGQRTEMGWKMEVEMLAHGIRKRFQPAYRVRGSVDLGFRGF